jgi:hypothetical protein
VYNLAGARDWRWSNMYTSHRRRRAFHDPEGVPRAFDTTLAIALVLLVLIVSCVLALSSAATL